MSSEFVDEKLPTEILSKLASFREFDKFCDVILEGDSSSRDKSEPTSPTSIRAHKLVLAAASPYFRKTFSSCSYENSNEIRIVVEDIDGKTLRVLVDYMYTGRIVINENNVHALFGAAEILQLDCIRNECLRYLIEHLSISNCMESAAFAKTHSCIELDDAAVSFAGQHFGKLVESEPLLLMDESSFLHFISDDRLNPKGEDAVFEAVINWVKHDSSRQASLPNVLSGIRLPLMSREFLLDRVYNEPMIQGSPACMGMLGTVFHDMLSENKSSRVHENGYGPRQTKMIMIAGGRSIGCLFLADVNIYDPCSKQWTSAAPLLEPRCDFGMATVGDSIYAVGGEDASGSLQSVEIYDAQRNSWRAGPEMQRCRFGLGVTAFNGALFAVGGNSANNVAMGEVEMLDPRQGKWISLPSTMSSRCHLGLAAVNGLVYAAGGNSGSQVLNSVEVYDLRACRWTTAQPMLKKRNFTSATVFRDQIVVVGGVDESKMRLTSAEMLTDNGWTFLPEMSQPRESPGVVNFDGSLFAFGGSAGGKFLSCIEYLDFNSSKWEVSQVRMPRTNCYFGIALFP